MEDDDAGVPPPALDAAEIGLVDWFLRSLLRKYKESARVRIAGAEDQYSSEA